MATTLQLQQAIDRVLALHAAKITEANNQLSIQIGRQTITLSRPPARPQPVYQIMTRRR